MAGQGFWKALPPSTEVVYQPDVTVTDGASLIVTRTYVWGVTTAGAAYYNAAGVTPGDEALLVIDAAGNHFLRPVEV